jgi:ArsR family transcriptional regulator
MSQRVFEALASEVRRGMLVVLAEGEMSAGDIAARFDISKPAISQHLTILDGAGLVTRRKKGQYVYYGLAAAPLTGALQGLLDDMSAASAAAAARLPRAAAAAPAKRETRRELPPVPAPDEMTEPVPADPSLGVGYRWEAWRTRGNP